MWTVQDRFRQSSGDSSPVFEATNHPIGGEFLLPIPRRRLQWSLALQVFECGSEARTLTHARAIFSLLNDDLDSFPGLITIKAISRSIFVRQYADFGYEQAARIHASQEHLSTAVSL